jgi:hypothetical protein
MTATNEPERYVLGIAYAPGKDSRIKKGLDGFRDYFTEHELELASRTFMKSLDSGVMHVDGTLGHAEIVESYIYRGPDWLMKAANGQEVLVKAGAWLVGAVLDADAWQAVKSGRLTGWSPQGGGTRIRKVTP